MPHPYTTASLIFLVHWQIFPNFACRGRIRKSSNFDLTIGKTNRIRSSATPTPLIEMFVTVPPVGRCTKQLTSSRWILLGSVIIIIVLEGGQKLATISDIASLYKKW